MTTFYANSTPASPGLNVNTPGQPIPGIPPNMSVMAAISAGLLPANAMTTNFGTRDGRPGQALLEVMGKGAANGVNSKFTSVNGGSQHNGPAGSCSIGAGGFNQTNDPGAGETSICPHNAPATVPTIPAQPVYQG